MAIAVLLAYSCLIVFGIAVGVGATQVLLAWERGTDPPCCADCRYPLVGLDDTAPCPECNATRRSLTYGDANPRRTRRAAAITALATATALASLVIATATIATAFAPVTILLVVCVCIYTIIFPITLDAIPRKTITLLTVLALPAGFGLAVGPLLLQRALGLSNAQDALIVIFATPIFAAGAHGWALAVATARHARTLRATA